jgi:hypoxanthine phosphoribosyltransferase
MSDHVAILSDRVKVLRDADEIRDKVRELGGAVARDYAGLNPVLVGVLKGASVFHADLARATPIELELDFVSASSYGLAKRSLGSVALQADLRGNVMGRHVILCEAVVDSGRTLSVLIELLRARRPASLKVAALFDKRPCREVDVPLDYVGWTVGAEFLVGYGLDAAERHRNLPYVGVLEEA